MRNILLVLVFSLFPLPPANAQVSITARPQVSPSPLPVTPKSPKGVGVISKEVLPTSSLDIFPKLPPSSLCTKEKLLGTWKLLMVYEVPSGREMKTYSDYPLQYYVFRDDSRYGEYIGPLQALTLAEVQRISIDAQTNTRQFVISDKGMLFFYNNRLAVDSLACFIVEGASPPFRIGQMLLMPPEKAAAKGRMVKVYQRMAIEFEAPAKPYTGMVVNR